jgi:hypothetical protein
MEYHDNKLSATFEEITEGDDPIMRLGTLKSKLSRGLVQYARRAKGRGVKALIDVMTMPKEIQQELITRYGLPEKPTLKAEVVEVARDVKALNYFNQYRYYNGQGEEQSLPSDIILEYTLNASVLNVLIQEEKRLRAMGNKLNNNRTDIGGILLSLSEALRREYGHNLPASERRLREKLRDYKKKGYATLISRAMGNSNSTKITEEAGEYLVALKLSKLPTLSHEDILEAYNYKCQETGWKPLESIQALRNYLYSPAVKPKWYGGRVGELTAYQVYGYKHKTTMPEKRDALWYIDGTKLNLYYNKEGKLATAMVVEVIDAYSDCLLGYAITETEDFQAQYRAVRMALEKAGHRPYELVHDNQGGQTSKVAKEWFDRIALVHRTTQPNRPQSKTIENLFGRFQQEVLKRMPWFTGANVTAKNDENRPDLEWIKANLNLLPRSLEELEEQYVVLREEWNLRKHHRTGVARIEMYETSHNEALTPFSEADYEALFLLTRPRTIRFEGRGLVLESGKQEYAYDAYTETQKGKLLVDFEWRLKNIGQEFVVRYDPEDLSKLYLYKETANGLRFERIVTSKVVVARAIQEQTSSDAEYIRYIQQADKEARLALVVEQRAITATWQVGKVSLAPDPKGTNAKEREALDRQVDLLTQEKLQRNEAKGIPTTPTPEPIPTTIPLVTSKQKRRAIQPKEIEPAVAYKKESLRTWDEVEVKVVEKAKEESLIDLSYLIETKDDLKQRIRDKY